MPIWLETLLTIGAGCIAGFINTLAGCGSAVSLALLNALGLPLDVANGTNRVAILLQTLVAVRIFRQKQLFPPARETAPLILPAALGAIVGAWLAGCMDRSTFRFTVGMLLLVVLVLLFIKPRAWLEQHKDIKRRSLWLLAPIYFLIGIYGGFIQMGIGVFLLVALVWVSGFDLLVGNAVKILIVFVLTMPALIVFALQGNVHWHTGLVLACGNMLGAWLAAREAAKRGAPFIRALLIVVVIAASTRYLGLWAQAAALFSR